MKKLLATLALVLASCNESRSTLAPVNSRAESIAGLGWVVVIGFAVTGAVMWILLGWAATRRRGTFEGHRLVSEKDGMGWITVGGLVIPVLAFGGLLAMSLSRMHTSSPEAHAMSGMEMQPDIVVTGHRWWWQVEYRGAGPSESIASANEIRIPTGKLVTIELHSADVIHSFWVPKLEGKVDLIPGHVTHIAFSADEPGRYEGQCGEYCGEEHARMRLVVIAMPPADYAAWRAHEQADAPEPTDPKERRGLAVFQTKACALCHAVRGTRAHATVGPDLTHFAERAELAANSYPNNRGYLGGWIVHAQGMKPAAEMPDLATLTGEELDALVAYLEALR
jgi:cytochrome c oxidase subunit 2